MRQLGVTRKKSFVASLGRVQFYIEDRENGDTIIKDVPTRKLFELKNGATETAEIGDNAACLFAIGSLASKDFCIDVYSIPEGTDDVVLSGKNVYNPAAGNPFRFDNNNYEVSRQIRSGANKRALVGVFIALVIMGIVFALTLSNRIKRKTFTKDGLSITLDTSFKEEKNDDFNAVYNSSKRGVFVMTTNDVFPAGTGYTLQEYCEELLDYMEISQSELKTYGDGYYFEYNATDSGNTYSYAYVVFVFQKSDDNFWIIQFGSLKSKAAGNMPMYKKWVDSIKFK